MKSRASRWFVVLLLTFFLLPWMAVAQEAAPQSQPAPRAEGQKLSPEEAAELLRSVDRHFKFVSDRTKLPILRPVKRELVSREHVREFLAKRMQEDESAQRLRRSEVVLKKFGLLPHDFQLGPFLLDLLGEQVAGYYDSKTKTVYLLDWVEPEQQEPVLVHELTHAIMDQHFDLAKWLNPGGDRSDSLDADGEPDLELDDASAARQALSEGQAMAVFLDYLLLPRNRQFQFEPQTIAIIRDSFMRSNDEFPMFRSAPLMLKESLGFPYNYGLEFVRHALLKGGRELTYSGLMKDPPRTTRDIMMPARFLEGERLPTMRLPKLRPALSDRYQSYDAGTLGQFDMMILLKHFRGERIAERLSPHWRAGAYYAAIRGDSENAKDATALKPSDVALMFVTRWSDSESAQHVAEAYGAGLPKKYSSLEASAGSTPAAQRWQTAEGPVFIETQGDLLLVMEGFDEETAGRLREAIRGLGQLPPGFPRLVKEAAPAN
jgi:hypothetical protein